MASLALLPLSGCYRKPTVPWGTVAGRVTVEGQPVNQGTVIFENREVGVSRMAELSSDGTFVQKSVDFAGLPVGKYHVAVSPLGISRGDWKPAAQGKPENLVTQIPKRYRTIADSDLTAEVKEGKNAPFEFDLQK